MKGVIFDFNGTLLLDDEINKIAWKTYAKEKLNIIMTDEDYYKYNGTPGENWIVGLTKGQITGEDAVKHRIGKEGQYRKELKDANIDLIKGAKEFFEKLKEANILGGIKIDENRILVCTTEMNTEEDLKNYIDAI